jgi:8-oxo-dGTP pyrophosphatase MutT (NUDIX family)
MSLSKLSYNHFITNFRKLRFDNLPGIESHLKMAPSIRETDIRLMGVGKNPILSAVMILIYPNLNGLASLVLIRRTKYGGTHSGQVSFPGGRYDTTDQSLTKTALRETYEEIGVEENQIDIIGRLTDLYIPPSNFMVSPFMATTKTTPTFLPDPKEVASLIEVEVNDLFDPTKRGTDRISLQEGTVLETPCFFLNGNVVWGATAMILNEFLDHYQKENGQ